MDPGGGVDLGTDTTTIRPEVALLGGSASPADESNRPIRKNGHQPQSSLI